MGSVGCDPTTRSYPLALDQTTAKGPSEPSWPTVYFKCDIRWCDDSLLFNDLVIAIDFEARDTLLHSAGPEDFNIYGLIRRQHSQPEEDSLIVRREIA